jgi:hypothetical protein
MCALDVAWIMQIASKLFGPEENIGLSVCLWGKKLRLEARVVNWGLCRRWNADFAAFSDQSC